MDMDLKPVSRNNTPPQAPLVEPVAPQPVMTEDPFKADAPAAAGGKVPKQRRNHSGGFKKFLMFVLVMLLIGGSAGGTYYWQHKKVTALRAQVSSLAPKTTGTTSAASTYVMNMGTGFPLSAPTKKVTLGLSLPLGNNVLQTEPHTLGQNELVAYYTESNNDLLAHWIFNTKGTEKDPSGSLDNVNEINVSELTKWLAVDDAAGITYPDATTSMTKVQKAKFVADLKASTTACVKDAAKGVATADKVFNICYTLNKPQAQGADWSMSLSGYAESGGTVLYLRGLIRLPDSATVYQPVADSYLQALKQFTTSVGNK